MDYASSKSGEAAYELLSVFKGTLVCDGASNFNLSVRRNGLKVALCNDHSRRRFRRVLDKQSKEGKQGALGSIAGAAAVIYDEFDFYASLARGLFCRSRSVGILSHPLSRDKYFLLDS